MDVRDVVIPEGMELFYDRLHFAPAVKDRVQKDRADGQAAGISSTPTLFINGKEYSGTTDLAATKRNERKAGDKEADHRRDLMEGRRTSRKMR